MLQRNVRPSLRDRNRAGRSQPAGSAGIAPGSEGKQNKTAMVSDCTRRPAQPRLFQPTASSAGSDVPSPLHERCAIDNVWCCDAICSGLALRWCKLSGAQVYSPAPSARHACAASHAAKREPAHKKSDLVELSGSLIELSVEESSVGEYSPTMDSSARAAPDHCSS